MRNTGHHGGYEVVPAQRRGHVSDPGHGRHPTFQSLAQAAHRHGSHFSAGQTQNQENSAFKGIKHLILNQAEGQLNTGLLMQAMLGHAKKVGHRNLQWHQSERNCKQGPIKEWPFAPNKVGGSTPVK